MIVHCLHVNCVMVWMAGMFSLPWLFVIHRKVKKNSSLVPKLEKWEHHLLRYIINPALVLTVLTGGYMIHRLAGWTILEMRWFQFKLFFLVMMFLTHGMLARYRKALLRGEKTQKVNVYVSASFLAMLLMVVINTLVLIKPF